VKKNRLNRLKFWKNQPVWFWFYKPKTEKTEPNPNRKKPSQIGKKPSQNRAKPEKRAKQVWTSFCPKRPNRNRSVWTGFSFFKKNILVWLLSFDKNQT
jgi:hypothetical protein